MEQIKIENLKFRYSLADEYSLDGINLTVNEGEYIVLCGKSGCGKTTLLRQLKPALAPKGQRSGAIYLDGSELSKAEPRIQAEKIGFVMQDPDNQIVTDKVWHELAFGLENLGLKTADIRLRVAEMASYFGIEEQFDRRVDELSGGQKQLLNLAAVMAMHPDIIILDEPTSQLDPIAADRFLATVNRINKDLGVTVIITEHRLEDVFTCADRIVVMDSGRITADGTPAEIGSLAAELPLFVKLALPTAMRIFSATGGHGNCPISVRDGRKWLNTQHLYHKRIVRETKKFSSESAITFKNVSFRYEKNGNDILSSLNLSIPKGSIFALLGGNGAGKTTVSRLISGTLKPYSGKIKISGSVSVLPQDVRSLFASRTVREELEEMSGNSTEIEKLSRYIGINHLADRHPYDISGGEQQRLAIAKILLCNSDVYFFDEPTKGMDAEFKSSFAEIISQLRSLGKTVVLISHDIEFCAKNAELCAMLFDKSIAAVRNTAEFFDGNRFYTTAANKISKGFIDSAVTDEDVIKCLRK